MNVNVEEIKREIDENIGQFDLLREYEALVGRADGDFLRVYFKKQSVPVREAKMLFLYSKPLDGWSPRDYALYFLGMAIGVLSERQNTMTILSQR